MHSDTICRVMWQIAGVFLAVQTVVQVTYWIIYQLAFWWQGGLRPSGLANSHLNHLIQELVEQS